MTQRVFRAEVSASVQNAGTAQVEANATELATLKKQLGTTRTELNKLRKDVQALQERLSVPTLEVLDSPEENQQRFSI